MRMIVVLALASASCSAPLAQGPEAGCGAHNANGCAGPQRAVATSAPSRRALEHLDSVSIEDRPLTRLAGEYALYQEDTLALGELEFSSLRDLNRTAAVMGAYDAERLAQGWIAYAAMTAARDPVFVDSVLEVADYYGREEFLDGLEKDPAYAAELPGAEGATRAIMRHAGSIGEQLRDAAGDVEKRSYTLQKSAWAKTASGNRRTRLSRLDADGEMGALADAPRLTDFSGAEARELDPRVSALTRSFGPALDETRLASRSVENLTTPMETAPQFRNTLDAAMTLAAMEVLGAADPLLTSEWDALVGEKQARMCFTTARLNLTQCMAATGYRYEEPFCMARHSLQDVGDCLSAMAGD